MAILFKGIQVILEIYIKKPGQQGKPFGKPFQKQIQCRFQRCKEFLYDQKNCQNQQISSPFYPIFFGQLRSLQFLIIKAMGTIFWHQVLIAFLHFFCIIQQSQNILKMLKISFKNKQQYFYSFNENEFYQQKFEDYLFNQFCTSDQSKELSYSNKQFKYSQCIDINNTKDSYQKQETLFQYFINSLIIFKGLIDMKRFLKIEKKFEGPLKNAYKYLYST
ncbi:unnamed protein product [Paramecium primaurelia]|uniref:Transmembrane protein n=1 Tax=Paramecium primaurelia TaxID=5886 RepID=A0A8S1MD06_PARPR|nr:unnamed protein product [Paramecium primaurelia]